VQNQNLVNVWHCAYLCQLAVSILPFRRHRILSEGHKHHSVQPHIYVRFFDLVFKFLSSNDAGVGPSGRAVRGVGLRPLPCWDCGFESHKGHGLCLLWVLCVLSGRGLCDELITRPDESYQIWCLVVYKYALAHWGLSRQKQTMMLVII